MSKDDQSLLIWTNGLQKCKGLAKVRGLGQGRGAEALTLATHYGICMCYISYLANFSIDSRYNMLKSWYMFTQTHVCSMNKWVQSQ